MPGKANSQDDQGAAAAAPDAPKPDMTIAKVDGQGRVIIPQGVVTLRRPSQLTLPIVASNHAPETRQLVSDLQYLVHALQNAPKGQPIPLDPSRFNFNRQAFDALLQGLNLDDPTQQLALQDRQELADLPIALRNTLAVDQGGHNVTLLLQFIATLMQNQGPINLINTGAAIEAQDQRSGRKIIVLPLEVLNAMRPLTIALQNTEPLALKTAMENACAALADLTHNTVVAVNYQPCTHLAQAVQANPMLPVALFAIPMPIIQALTVLQPGQQQAVFKLTPELIANLLEQFHINAVSAAEQIAQLQALANLVRTYATSKPQQEQLAALLGGADRQALAVIPSIAGGANQETNEQRLWIAAVVLDALAAQLAEPDVPLSFFATRNMQGQLDYGYAGVLHAIRPDMVTQLTKEQADLLNKISKMPRQALGQSTSTAEQPQQPAPQPGQPGWGAWLYNNLPTGTRVLTEILRRL